MRASLRRTLFPATSSPDILAGHPDERWSKLYHNMTRTLGRNEARKMAEDEFPPHQLNRIRMNNDF